MPCIAAAIESNIPVLTAVREPYLDSWRTFDGGLGTEIEPRLNEAPSWCLAVTGPSGIDRMHILKNQVGAHSAVATSEVPNDCMLPDEASERQKGTSRRHGRRCETSIVR